MTIRARRISLPILGFAFRTNHNSPTLYSFRLAVKARLFCAIPWVRQGLRSSVAPPLLAVQPNDDTLGSHADRMLGRHIRDLTSPSLLPRPCSSVTPFWPPPDLRIAFVS